MTNHAELLKTAAAEIEARDAQIVELTAKVASLTSDNVVLAEGIKASTTGQQKVAADLAPLAKAAADALLDKGMLKSAENADKLAASLTGSHGEALRAIAKIAGHLPGAQRLGTVVLAESKPETANEAWDRAMSAHS